MKKVLWHAATIVAKVGGPLSSVWNKHHILCLGDEQALVTFHFTCLFILIGLDVRKNYMMSCKMPTLPSLFTSHTVSGLGRQHQVLWVFLRCHWGASTCASCSPYDWPHWPPHHFHRQGPTSVTRWQITPDVPWLAQTFESCGDNDISELIVWHVRKWELFIRCKTASWKGIIDLLIVTGDKSR